MKPKGRQAGAVSAEMPSKTDLGPLHQSLGVIVYARTGATQHGTCRLQEWRIFTSENFRNARFSFHNDHTSDGSRAREDARETTAA